MTVTVSPELEAPPAEQTPPGHAAASLLLQAVFRCEREIGAAISLLRWDTHLNVRAVHLDVNGNVRIDADLHPFPR